MPDDELSRLIKEQEELIKKQTEQMKKIRQMALDRIKGYVDEIIGIGNTLSDRNETIKKLEARLREERAGYVTDLSRLNNAYNKAVNEVQLPEIKEMLDKEIEMRSPEVMDILKEDLNRTKEKATKYLRRQAQFIDPVDGRTYATWQQAAENYGISAKNESDAKKKFTETREYPLIELTSDSLKAVNDCINTPDCVPTTLMEFMNDVENKKLAVDDGTGYLDHIFEFLKQKNIQ